MSTGTTTGTATASATSATTTGSGSISPTKRTHEWEIRPDEIEILPSGLLGEGFFGAAYKAKWSATQDVVCVKKLKNVRAGELHNFWHEVNTCARLRCPYLVQFLGASTDAANLAIVLEFMTGGTLFDLLHRRTPKPPQQQQHTAPAATAQSNANANHKTSQASSGSSVAASSTAAASKPYVHPLGEWFVIRAARQIAMGCNYLSTAGIVHRDLTSSNVLLDDQRNCKVSDFGLSRNADAQISGAGGSLPYMSPESFLDQTFSSASDVYSFGLVLYELVTLTVPYSNIFPTPVTPAAATHNAAAAPAAPARPPLPLSSTPALCASKAAHGLRPLFPGWLLALKSSAGTSTTNVWVSLMALIERCWSMSSAARPTFKEIIGALTALDASIATTNGGGSAASGFGRSVFSAGPPLTTASSSSTAPQLMKLPSANTALSREFSATGNGDATALTSSDSSHASNGNPATATSIGTPTSASVVSAFSPPNSSPLQYLPASTDSPSATSRPKSIVRPGAKASTAHDRTNDATSGYADETPPQSSRRLAAHPSQQPAASGKRVNPLIQSLMALDPTNTGTVPPALITPVNSGGGSQQPSPASSPRHTSSSFIPVKPNRNSNANSNHVPPSPSVGTGGWMPASSPPAQSPLSTSPALTNSSALLSRSPSYDRPLSRPASHGNLQLLAQSRATAQQLPSPGSSPTAASLLLMHQQTLLAAQQQQHPVPTQSTTITAAGVNAELAANGVSPVDPNVFGAISDEIGSYLTHLREHLSTLPPVHVTSKPPPPATASASGSFFPSPAGGPATHKSGATAPPKSALTASIHAQQAATAAAAAAAASTAASTNALARSFDLDVKQSGAAAAPVTLPALSVRPPPHECSASLSGLRLYPSPLPSIGELVVVRSVRSSTRHGSSSGGSGGASALGADGDLASCLFALSEYGSNVFGMAAVQELSRRRIRSVAKLVRADTEDVLRVIRVDKTGGVDLSKRDLTEREKQHTLRYQRQAMIVHQIVCSVAATVRCCAQCLYANLVWPLAARHGSAFRAFRLALIDPIQVFSEFRHCNCYSVNHNRAGGTSRATAAGTATTSTGAPSALASIPIFLSPRVLPEVERRLAYNRDTLDLSKLGLNCLPLLLLQKYERKQPLPAMPLPLPVAQQQSTSNSNAGDTKQPAQSAPPAQPLQSRPKTPPSNGNGSSAPIPIAGSNSSSSRGQPQRSNSDESATLAAAAARASAAAAAASVASKPTQFTSLLTQQLAPKRSSSANSSSSASSAGSTPLTVSPATSPAPPAAKSVLSAIPLTQPRGGNEKSPSGNRPTGGGVTKPTPASKAVSAAAQHPQQPAVVPLRNLSLEDNPFGATTTLASIDALATPPVVSAVVKIGGLPPEIGLFDALEELNLNACGLTDLPESMSRLVNLNALYLYGNQLTAIPSVLCTLRSLEVLNLSNNALAAIPASFGALNRLTELSLHHNALTDVSESAFRALKQLRALDLSSNRFTSIPDVFISLNGALPSLTSLEMRHNALTGTVPATIVHTLISLEWLDLSRNQLSNVDTLIPMTPANGKAGGLSFLDVSHNPMLHLSPQTISALSAISEFNYERCGSGGAVSSAMLPSPLKAKSTVGGDSKAGAEQRSVTPRNHNASSSSPPTAGVAASAAAADEKHITRWDSGDVNRWLDRESFSAYRTAFEENDITGASLVDLDRDDLKEMGVTKIGHLKQMLKAIQTEKQKPVPAAVVAATATPTASSRRPSNPPLPLPTHSPALSKSGSGGSTSGVAYELAPLSCDIANCEVVRSVLLRHVHASAALRELVRVRCVIQMTCFRGRTGVDVIRAACAAAKRLVLATTPNASPILPPASVPVPIASASASGSASAAGDVSSGAGAPPSAQSPVITPFDGLYGGCARSGLSITTILPPLYCLSVSALIPEHGFAFLEECVSVMRGVLNGHAGHIAVCVPPYTVPLPPDADDAPNDPMADGDAAPPADQPMDEIESALEELAMNEATATSDELLAASPPDSPPPAGVDEKRAPRRSKSSRALPISASVTSFVAAANSAGGGYEL